MKKGSGIRFQEKPLLATAELAPQSISLQRTELIAEAEIRINTPVPPKQQTEETADPIIVFKQRPEPEPEPEQKPEVIIEPRPDVVEEKKATLPKKKKKTKKKKPSKSKVKMLLALFSLLILVAILFSLFLFSGEILGKVSQIKSSWQQTEKTKLPVRHITASIGKKVIYLRYGFFLKEVNATHFAEKLSAKGIDTEIREAIYPVKAYALKVGPIVKPNSRKSMITRLKKLGVELTPPDGKEYLLSKPFWSSVVADAARQRVEDIGGRTEIIIGRMPRNIFKVTSAELPSEQDAIRMSDIAREQGIKSVVERL